MKHSEIDDCVCSDLRNALGMYQSHYLAYDSILEGLGFVRSILSYNYNSLFRRRVCHVLWNEIRYGQYFG